jgi:CRISPR/Cas system-associated protein Csx1
MKDIEKTEVLTQKEIQEQRLALLRRMTNILAPNLNFDPYQNVEKEDDYEKTNKQDNKEIQKKWNEFLKREKLEREAIEQKKSDKIDRDWLSQRLL